MTDYDPAYDPGWSHSPDDHPNCRCDADVIVTWEMIYSQYPYHAQAFYIDLIEDTPITVPPSLYALLHLYVGRTSPLLPEI
jgi:hypothetical protein